MTGTASAVGADSAFQLTAYTPHERNTWVAFVSFLLPSGLIVNGCTFHTRGASRWVSPPAKPYQNDDGGTSWQPIVEFDSKGIRDRFVALALQAIDEYLEGESAGGAA